MYNAKPKMPKKKLIEIICLIIGLVWLLFFLIDYVRYTSSKHPLLSIKIVSNYTDGKVTEYYALGYIYRVYDRNAIQKEELVPFWVIRENPESEEDLPKTYSGYNVPENPYKTDKYKGLLYYYQSSELIGTYKCINSTKNCEKATGGTDSFNTENKDYLTKHDPYKLEVIKSRYAFIDDSVEQSASPNDSNYIRTIYLFDIIENKIIARYSNIKTSKYDDFEEQGTGDNYKYIVKEYNGNKWGIIEVTEDGINEIKPYEYDSISYDEDTGYYIMSKDGKWYIYDLETDKIVSNEQDEIIYDVWTNDNQTTYYKTGKDRTVGDETYTEFKINRLDGQEFITTEGYILIYPTPKYIMMLSKDNYIKFIDYGSDEKYRIELSFHSFKEDEFTKPCFKLEKVNLETNSITLLINKGPELGSEDDLVVVNTKYWD